MEFDNILKERPREAGWGREKENPRSCKLLIRDIQCLVTAVPLRQLCWISRHLSNGGTDQTVRGYFVTRYRCYMLPCCNVPSMYAIRSCVRFLSHKRGLPLSTFIRSIGLSGEPTLTVIITAFPPLWSLNPQPPARFQSICNQRADKW